LLTHLAAANTPHEVAYHPGGSSLCHDIDRGACQNAGKQFNDASIYTFETHFVATADNAINHWFGPIASQGKQHLKKL